MCREIENSPAMTRNEACVHYPDEFILMQKNEAFMFDPVGVVQYVGDDFDELFALQVDLPVLNGVVFEGLNLQRRHSLGGIVVG